MLYPEKSMVNMMESSLAETMVSTALLIVNIRETIRWQQKRTLRVWKCCLRAQLYEAS